MGHEERKRSATAVGYLVAGDNVCMSPPDATGPPAHALTAASE